jgi:hypothetical protein
VVVVEGWLWDSVMAPSSYPAGMDMQGFAALENTSSQSGPGDSLAGIRPTPTGGCFRGHVLGEERVG